jgi:hypothetical protein
MDGDTMPFVAFGVPGGGCSTSDLRTIYVRNFVHESLQALPNQEAKQNFSWRNSIFLNPLLGEK